MPAGGGGVGGFSPRLLDRLTLTAHIPILNITRRLYICPHITLFLPSPGRRPSLFRLCSPHYWSINLVYILLELKCSLNQLWPLALGGMTGLSKHHLAAQYSCAQCFALHQICNFNRVIDIRQCGHLTLVCCMERSSINPLCVINFYIDFAHFVQSTSAWQIFSSSVRIHLHLMLPKMAVITFFILISTTSVYILQNCTFKTDLCTYVLIGCPVFHCIQKSSTVWSTLYNFRLTVEGQIGRCWSATALTRQWMTFIIFLQWHLSSGQIH